MKTKNRIFNILIAILLVASMVAIATPSAQAQLEQACGTANRASIDPPAMKSDGRIKPIVLQKDITGTFVYRAPESARSLTPVQVTFDAKPEDNSWATVAISPKTFEVTFEPNGATSQNIPVTVTVFFNKNAPAFAQQNIKITATANDGTCVVAPSPAEVTLPVQADFYQRYQAQFDKAIWQTGQNSQVQIPLTVQNFGNGDIEVRMSINERTSKALNVAPPAQLTVKTMVGGGDTDRETVNIDVQTPFKNGYTNQRDALVLDIKGNSADDPDIKITELQLNAVIQTQGVYVPGFEAVTMLTALIGAVLAARRLR